MTKAKFLKPALMGGACATMLATAAFAASFDIPAGDLKAALAAYSKQSGVALIVSGDAIGGAKTSGVRGDLSDEAALTRILSDTGFVMHRHPSGAIAVVPGQTSEVVEAVHLAQVGPVSTRAVETVTVTSSKLGGADVQSIPISITALVQEQLRPRRQTAVPIS